MFGAIETPRLVLDKGRLERNAARFLEHTAAHGVLLRPHLKTSKSVDVARVATGGRMSGVIVSTLKEAEYFAYNGFGDIMYGVGITPNKFSHARRVVQDIAGDLLLITDDVSVARAAATFAEIENCSLRFLIEVDCGEHRGGTDPEGESLLEIARILHESPAVEFMGVMTHAGHSYTTDDPAQVRAIAEAERLAVVGAANRLAGIGIACEIVSVGSTPTVLWAESYEGLTEVRCGVYLFCDLAQVSRKVCTLDDIAVSVLSTVIGHNRQGDALIIDAGALALSKDVGANTFLPDAGYGYVCDALSLQRLGSLSVEVVHQEHGSVPVDDESWFERLPVGSLVRVLPNHVCMTASAHRNYVVVDQGVVNGEWPRISGW